MNVSILTHINKSYFWDVDLNSLDEVKSKRLIIERVVTLGNLNELKLLFDYYGKDEVKNTLRKLNYLDPKTLNIVALMFNIPKSSFKCFTRKQLTNQQLNF